MGPDDVKAVAAPPSGDRAPADGRSGLAVAWARAAVVGVVAYVLIDLALAVLRPDVRLLHDPESDYGNGPWSWLMDANFLLRGGLSLAAAIALASSLLGRHVGPTDLRSAGSRAMSSQPPSSSRATRLGLTLLMTWAVASTVLAFVPDDLRGATPTRHGELHLLAAIVGFVCVATATVLLSRVVSGLPAWATVARTLSILSVGGVAALVLLGLSRLPYNAFGGLWERVFLALELAWILISSLPLARAGDAGVS